MAEMTFRDRLKIAALSAERSQRSAIAQTLATWLPAWSVAPHPVDRLLIVPQDLRTADPSFWREIEHGQFGLAGSIAFLHGRSPFDIAPPTAAWERELHSFGWLRNLAAATDDDEARRGARLLASEWAIRFGSNKGIAAEPVVAARRLISWVSHATLLLEGADAATYEAITMSLGRQIALLASSRRDAPDGYPRLLTLIALMFAELSVAGQKRKLKDVEPTLVAELRRQILPDGGHMSRNPDVLVELLLDLLPLNQCFAARNRESPPSLSRCWRACRRCCASSDWETACLRASTASALPRPLGWERSSLMVTPLRRCRARRGLRAMRGSRVERASLSSTSGRRPRLRSEAMRRPAASPSR